MPGLDSLKHIVVLMLGSRSFDQMLGALKATDPRIDGLTGTESNLDTTGKAATVQPLAGNQGRFDPVPAQSFPAVDLQIFGGTTAPARTPTMQGFLTSYLSRQRDVRRARRIMSYFNPDRLPVLTTLAREFAVFNRWFASIPGPALCNRSFAHYGTSFGHVGTEVFYANQRFKSIYERLAAAGLTAKIYCFDLDGPVLEVINLLQQPPAVFGTYPQFLRDCKAGTLPAYSFIEPSFVDHETGTGLVPASDQHPAHDVLQGERLTASVYNAIRTNPVLWSSTALLVVYDVHGGFFDHVPPPACTPDGFVAEPQATGTDRSFPFDRLGVRVPAVLVSPWVPKGTVVSDRVFEHASIPATVTDFFLHTHPERSPREKAAQTFLDLLTSSPMRTASPEFKV
jgi:phospholipase C